MLLPALNNARERGRSASCIGNLKQIGLQTIMYMDSTNGFIPGPPFDSSYRWAFSLYKFDKSAGSQMLYCPSTESVKFDYKEGDERAAEENYLNWTYGMMAHYYPYTQYTNSRIYRDLGRTALFGEGVKPTGDKRKGYSYISRNKSIDSALMLRHSGSTNLLLGDMHVESVKENFVVLSEPWLNPTVALAAWYKPLSEIYNIAR